jgi:hypothetical protein
VGTSTFHRSPNTARWQIVNHTYDDPAIRTNRVLSEILNAAEGYQAGLAERVVFERVNALISAARQAQGLPAEKVVETARYALIDARQRLLDKGQTSFFADLADRAASATLVEATRRPELLARPVSAVEAFTSNLIANSVAHLMARDLSAHVGAPRTKDAAMALQFRRAVVDQARDLVGGAGIQSAIEAVAREPRKSWKPLVRLLWQQAASLNAESA